MKVCFEFNENSIGTLVRFGSPPDESTITLSLGNKDILDINDVSDLTKIINESCNTLRVFNFKTLSINIINKTFCSLQVQIMLLHLKNIEVNFVDVDENSESISIISNEKNQLVTKLCKETHEFMTLPPNTIFPETFINYVREKYPHLSIEVLNHDDILKEGLNLIDAVGKGSIHPPHMLILKHNYNEESNVVILGKGVCYDSGGYALKSPEHMTGMKYDKTGACYVVGIFEYFYQTNHTGSFVGICPLVENLIGPNATKNDDIITAHNGLRVEITNTDAEGRLILADAASFSARYNPSLIIDIATLTGTYRIISQDYSIVIGTDDEFIEKVIKTGESINDLMWRLPMTKDLVRKGVIADDNKHVDIINSDKDEKMGSTMEGACFIYAFIPDITGNTTGNNVKWVHFDIGGCKLDTPLLPVLRSLLMVL